jgi:hypothetical protein
MGAKGALEIEGRAVPVSNLDKPLYPSGFIKAQVIEKRAPGFTPAWVAIFPVPRRGGKDIHYILINNLATLVWCANLANLGIHPFLHRVPAIDTPNYVVFDLDPGEGADVISCAEVAFLVFFIQRCGRLRPWLTPAATPRSVGSSLRVARGSSRPRRRPRSAITTPQ